MSNVAALRNYSEIWMKIVAAKLCYIALEYVYIPLLLLDMLNRHVASINDFFFSRLVNQVC